jgi:hypothetical protein
MRSEIWCEAAELSCEVTLGHITPTSRSTAHDRGPHGRGGRRFPARGRLDPIGVPRCSGATAPSSPRTGPIRAHTGRLDSLSVSQIKSVLYGAFVWARRALDRRKRRLLAWMDSVAQAVCARGRHLHAPCRATVGRSEVQRAALNNNAVHVCGTSELSSSSFRRRTPPGETSRGGHFRPAG